MFSIKTGLATAAIAAVGRIGAASGDEEIQDECIEAICEIEFASRLDAPYSSQHSFLFERGKRRREERRKRMIAWQDRVRNDVAGMATNNLLD